MLNVIDEFTHECLAIRVARKLKAIDVIDVLSDLFILRGVPGHIRSDNGPEFIAKAVQEWISAVGAKTAYIAPGSPWENGYVESFNARLSDELLDRETSRLSTRGRSSSRAGAVITLPSASTQPLATRHRPLRCSCQLSPHGRLRNPTSSAGHATRGAPTNPKRTLTPDDSSGGHQVNYAEAQVQAPSAYFSLPAKAQLIRCLGGGSLPGAAWTGVIGYGLRMSA